MNPKFFASLLIASVLFMSFPLEAYAISQSFRDEICQDASDEARDSIQKNAPEKNPSSQERRIFNERADFYRVQAEQFCRDASPKVQQINIDGIASAALGILASLTQTYGTKDEFMDQSKSFLAATPQTCGAADIEEFANQCESFLQERIGDCTEADVSDFSQACGDFMANNIAYCELKEIDNKAIENFGGIAGVFFDQEYPACADLDEGTNLVDQYVDQCKEFIDEGRDFCLDLLHDAQGVVVDIQKKIVDIGIDAAWKIPYAILREAALIAVKVADRVTWRRIESEAKKRRAKIEKVHDDLVKLCMPDTLIQKGRSGSIESTVAGMLNKMVSACIGSFF